MWGDGNDEDDDDLFVSNPSFAMPDTDDPVTDKGEDVDRGVPLEPFFFCELNFLWNSAIICGSDGRSAVCVSWKHEDKHTITCI